ncbi:hypothetical protein ACCO45_007800 [Purpureocillium lilacinum]|uniref:Uncharacterized protein n=1 Tax=Purpureocillium lilacinum TaxID=33203 RepID=A0ACC4DM98_PURLI
MVSSTRCLGCFACGWCGAKRVVGAPAWGTALGTIPTGTLRAKPEVGSSEEAGAPDASALRAREANYQEKPFFATDPGAETGTGEGPLCHLTHTFGTQVPDWHAARAGGGGVGWTRFRRRFAGASAGTAGQRRGTGTQSMSGAGGGRSAARDAVSRWANQPIPCGRHPQIQPLLGLGGWRVPQGAAPTEFGPEALPRLEWQWAGKRRLASRMATGSLPRAVAWSHSHSRPLVGHPTLLGRRRLRQQAVEEPHPAIQPPGTSAPAHRNVQTLAAGFITGDGAWESPGVDQLATKVGCTRISGATCTHELPPPLTRHCPKAERTGHPGHRAWRTQQ